MENKKFPLGSPNSQSSAPYKIYISSTSKLRNGQSELGKFNATLAQCIRCGTDMKNVQSVFVNIFSNTNSKTVVSLPTESNSSSTSGLSKYNDDTFSIRETNIVINSDDDSSSDGYCISLSSMDYNHFGNCSFNKNINTSRFKQDHYCDSNREYYADSFANHGSTDVFDSNNFSRFSPIIYNRYSSCNSIYKSGRPENGTEESSFGNLPEFTNDINSIYKSCRTEYVTEESNLGILPEFSNDINSIYKSYRYEDVTEESSIGILPDCVKDINSIYKSCRYEDVTEESSIGILPDCVKDINSIYKSCRPEDVTEESSLGILPEFVNDINSLVTESRRFTPFEDNSNDRANDISSSSKPMFSPENRRHKKFEIISDTTVAPCKDCHVAVVDTVGDEGHDNLEVLSLMFQMSNASDIMAAYLHEYPPQSEVDVGFDEIPNSWKSGTFVDGGLDSEIKLSGTGGCKEFRNIPDLDPEAEAAYQSHLLTLVPCEFCQRTFNPDRVMVHEKVCINRPKRTEQE